MATMQPDPKRPMELEGSLSAFNLPEILQFLSLGRMTGELSVQQLEYRLVIGIIKGKIVNTRASSRINQIGQMLVNRGLVSAEAMDQFLETQRLIDPDKKIGQILVERKIVSLDHLTDCLRVQIEEEIWPLFNTQEGEFKFENKSEDAIEALPIRLDIETLIMEGTRRRDEWEIIQELIPNEMVVMMAALPEPDNPDGPNAETIDRSLRYELTELRPSEWEILARVDGLTTVGTICKTSPVGKFETFHVLYALMSNGFLKVRGEMLTDPLEAPDFRRIPWDTLLQRGDGKPHGGAVSRFRSFLTRGTPPSDAQSNTFASPVSCLARFTNDLSMAFSHHASFGRSQTEQNLLCRHWQQALMAHPLADMIRFTGFGLDAQTVDDYILTAEGIAPEMREVMQGCLNALTQYLEMIIETAQQRLGAKTAKPIVTQMLERYKSMKVLNGQRWELDSRVSGWL